MAWTDDRMDDLASQMAAGFARTDHEIGTLRAEMREGFRDMRVEFRGDMEASRVEFKGDMEALRVELKGDVAELRGDIDALRSMMMRFGVGHIIGLLGLVGTLIGAILANPLGG